MTCHGDIFERQLRFVFSSFSAAQLGLAVRCMDLCLPGLQFYYRPGSLSNAVGLSETMSQDGLEGVLSEDACHFLPPERMFPLRG